MTIEQALARYAAKCEQLQKAGADMAAHDYRKDASDLRRLWHLAEQLPPVRRKAAKR